MSLPREKVDVKRAIDMMPDGDEIHTFRNAGPILIGADWPRSAIIAAIEMHGCELSGEQATSMGHGLCLFDDNGPLFIATR